jgi:4-amino-4-deoxy-L-arabinose transferase-like glycosyltransferase
MRQPRDRAYFILMGGCITALILAWTVIRLFSVTAAIVVSLVVAIIPPIAAIVANAGDEGSRRR